jgi:hypothetical protein
MAYGRVEVYLHSFLAQDDIDGQLHTPSALPLGMNAATQWILNSLGSTTDLAAEPKRKNPFPCRDSNSCHPARIAGLHKYLLAIIFELWCCTRPTVRKSQIIKTSILSWIVPSHESKTVPYLQPRPSVPKCGFTKSLKISSIRILPRAKGRR